VDDILIPNLQLYIYYTQYTAGGYMFQRSAILLIALGALATGMACAQHEGAHRGFWLSFGGGGGWMDGTRGAAGYVRMGGTPNSRVQFGGQVLHWWRGDQFGIETNRVAVTATGSIFPFHLQRGSRGPLQEWFLKLGFGVAAGEESWMGGEESGIALDAGTGFDLHLGGNFFVTPNVDAMFLFFNDTTNVSVVFTLGLTWH
jgi:hypothetical protein